MLLVAGLVEIRLSNQHEALKRDQDSAREREREGVRVRVSVRVSLAERSGLCTGEREREG